MTYLHQNLTNKIIKAYYKVYNTLGYGFLEKVYQKAMLIELRNMGLTCLEEMPVKVYYDGSNVGDYRADIVVNDRVIIENKAAENFVKKMNFS